MIQFERVEKQFGNLQVLRGIDLTIHPTGVTAIVGPNAAGKTTLMKAVLGLVRIGSGRILVNGEVLNGTSAYRRRIGYMAQVARFPEHLSGRELLNLVRDVRGASDDGSSATLIDAFDLGNQLDKPLGTVSGGTRQKVSATIALMFDPDVLLLDEPTAGLDPASSSYLKEVVATRRNDGKTIVMTSHVMSEIDELADRVIYLHDGRVQLDQSKSEIKSGLDGQGLDRALVARLSGIGV